LLVDPFNLSIETDLGYDIVVTKNSYVKNEVKNFIEWILAEKEKSS
jgi:molybdate-binding protein